MHLISVLLLALGTLTTTTTAAPQLDTSNANAKIFRNSTTGAPFPFQNAAALLAVAAAVDTTTSSPSSPEATLLASYASSEYVFNPDSHRNLAVYYGKTDLSQSQNLSSQCSDPNIDIVILGFVTEILGPGGYPVLALNNTSGELCELPNASMLEKGATGLRRCQVLQKGMVECQEMGKKVFISVGGANGNVTFEDAAQAETAAQLVWDLFGGGEGEAAALRPFGSAKFDGFDVDNESGDGANYATFARALRTLTTTAPVNKTIYLSAAPACYFPNPPAPLEMLMQVDFVWPQFYGAPSCNLGSSGFNASLSGWATRLSNVTATGVDTSTGEAKLPRLFIGAPAWDEATSTGGYITPSELDSTIQKAVEVVGTERFGGLMLWDAAYGHVTKDETSGLNIIAVAKASLLISGAREEAAVGIAKVLLVAGVAAVMGWCI